MNVLKIFWRSDCPLCPAAKELGARLKDEGVEVIFFDMDTADGLAEAAFHSVMGLPAMVLVTAEYDTEIFSWRGSVPELQEVKIKIDAATSE